VVHWGPPADLGRLAEAWPDDPRFELVVVDNGGQLPASLPAPRGRVLRPGRNLGFAGGADLGAAAARAPLLLFLNPDVRPLPAALPALLEGFRVHPDAAGLAPRLVGGDGRPQHRWQLRPLPGLGGLLAQGLFLSLIRGPEAEPPAGAPVAQPAAAALALRREAFVAAGGFDPRFFPAWFEDVDLARRLATGGATVRYWPAAAFEHRQGGSVAALGYPGFLWSYYRNLDRYLRKHHGAGGALALRLILAAGAPARLALVPLRRPARAASRGEAARGLLALAAGALSGWRSPPAAARLTTAPPAAGTGGEVTAGRRASEKAAR
jgi:hypothetical protein